MSEALPSLTLNQALRIVEAMDGAGLLQPPLPSSNTETMEKAAEILRQAHSAFRAGSKLTVIQAILDIANTAEESPPFEVDNPPVVVNNTVQQADALHTATPTEDDNASSEGMAASSTDATPIESIPEKEPSLQSDDWRDLPVLPRDYSVVSDLELRSLHAVRVALQSKVIFELGLEEADYDSAQVSYDVAYKMNQQKSDGKVSEKREFSFLSPEVEKWREKVTKHHHQVIILRSMRDRLDVEVKGLSREWTMRSSEKGGV